MEIVLMITITALGLVALITIIRAINAKRVNKTKQENCYNDTQIVGEL